MTDTIEKKSDTSFKPVAKNFFDRQLDRVLRFGFRLAFRILFGVRTKGMEHAKAINGTPTVIIANHSSLLDGMLLAATLPVQPAFAISTDMYEKTRKNPVLRFLMDRLTLFPVDSTKPQSIKSMARLVASGQPLVIFPEGRLTTTGTLMQIFDGAGAVADAADAQILPVHIKGLHFLPFGTVGLKNHPRTLRPELTVTALPPRKLDLPEGGSARQRRKIRHRQLEGIMRAMPVEALDSNRTLMDELHFAARHYGMKYNIVEDHMRDKLTYEKVIAGAYVLGDKLRKGTKRKENIGFLLPNSNGAAVTFFALQAYDRVPAMLNAAADIPTLTSCTTTASLKTVVTSRKFVELGKLEDKIEALAKTCKIVYLEDIRKKIGIVEKVTGLLKARGWLPRPKIKGEGRGSHPAVILFTSGSEGPPKGVVLSSSNILANIAQVHAVTPFGPADKVFNAMPIFHSFGLGGGLLMPMLKGIPSSQYPTPLDGKTIPKAAYMSDATIMFGTDTFLSLYARSTDSNADFNNLRMIFAGAEPLSRQTYETYFERFGVKIYQGYGMTEASPVVSINTPAMNESGTVGRFLPCLETRLEPVPDIPGGHRLYLKGPNIMIGYLRHDHPGVIHPPQDGWHDTGDIVSLTDNGFVKIAGRAKRFAKIGGEMVSLDAVENIARAASAQDKEQAAILRQQDGKPDEIVIYTTDPALKREQLSKAAQDLNRSALGLPKNENIVVLNALPKLATGKTDYQALKKLDVSFNSAAQKIEEKTASAATQNKDADKDARKNAPKP